MALLKLDYDARGMGSNHVHIRTVTPLGQRD